MLNTDIKNVVEYFEAISESGTVAVIQPTYMHNIVAMMEDWAKRAEEMENAPIPLDLQKRQQGKVLGPFEPGGAA